MDAFANAATLQYRLDRCDSAETIRFESCNDVLSCNLQDLPMTSSGRILEINARVKGVCPGKRTAVAFELHELDENDNEYARGIKMLTLPAHNENGARDILIQNLRFALPEELSLDSESSEQSASGVRRFVSRTTIHYIDAVYACPRDSGKK